MWLELVFDNYGCCAILCEIGCVTAWDIMAVVGTINQSRTAPLSQWKSDTPHIHKEKCSIVVLNSKMHTVCTNNFYCPYYWNLPDYLSVTKRVKRHIPQTEHYQCLIMEGETPFFTGKSRHFFSCWFDNSRANEKAPQYPSFFYFFAVFVTVNWSNSIYRLRNIIYFYQPV